MQCTWFIELFDFRGGEEQCMPDVYENTAILIKIRFRAAELKITHFLSSSVVYKKKIKLNRPDSNLVLYLFSNCMAVNCVVLYCIFVISEMFMKPLEVSVGCKVATEE